MGFSAISRRLRLFDDILSLSLLILILLLPFYYPVDECPSRRLILRIIIIGAEFRNNRNGNGGLGRRLGGGGCGCGYGCGCGCGCSGGSNQLTSPHLHLRREIVTHRRRGRANLVGCICSGGRRVGRRIESGVCSRGSPGWNRRRRYAQNLCERRCIRRC